MTPSNTYWQYDYENRGVHVMLINANLGINLYRMIQHTKKNCINCWNVKYLYQVVTIRHTWYVFD